MLANIKSSLQAAIGEAIQSTFDVVHEPIIEVPPRRELGDLAAPAPLHLARTLKRNPARLRKSSSDTSSSQTAFKKSASRVPDI